MDPGVLKPQDFLRLRVPDSLLPEIAAGTSELGEDDEPANIHHFGTTAEIFQMKYIGQIACPSGYVGIFDTEKTANGRADADWTRIRSQLDHGSAHFPDTKTGCLYAGHVLHSDSASVYKYEQDGAIRGLLIASNTEEVD